MLSGLSSVIDSTGSVYWGAVTGTQFDNGGQAPWDMNVVTDFSNEDAAGKGVSIVPFYSPWIDCSTSACSGYGFPRGVVDNIRGYGAIPMISWGSSSIQDGDSGTTNDSGFTLAAVASGRYDAYITAWAQNAKAWGQPFFLRFDWEMNGNWFVWGNTNTNTPAQYVAAWRHVHDIFGQVGATNATWVWCPNNGDQNGSIASMASYYPGSSYVDWSCLDAYDQGTFANGDQESWDQVAQASYDAITQQIAPGKPMMVGEFNAPTSQVSQATWLARMLAEVPVDYPQIHALVLYDVNPYAIEGDPASVAAFASAINSPTYTANRYATLGSGTIPAP